MRALSLAAALAFLLAAPLRAQEEVVCRVNYVASDGIYVDAGTDHGLAEGDLGRVLHAGIEIARARVVAVSSGSARLSLVSRSSDTAPQAGDRVAFRVDRVPVDEPAPTPEEAPKKDEPGSFVPLLERQGKQAKITQKSNVFHGWLSVRQLVQTGLTDYWTTIVGSSGSVERLGGAPWTLRWSGNLSARGGDGFDGSTLEGARLDLYELSLSRRLGAEASFIRLGRFLPYQLPSASYLDGAQGEFVLSDSLRVGVLAGFRPTRDDLTPSAKEPSAAVYATVTSGARGGTYYSGTFGALGSFYDGEFDRAVALVDQHLEFASGLAIDSSAEIDFDVGSAMFLTGTRLTQFNARVTAPVGKSTRLRAGVDHYEHPDNAAERAALGTFADPAYYDRGSWRYFGGFAQQLPAQLTLDLEVAVINSPDTDDTPHVNLNLTRRGLFGSPNATLTLNVYNLEGSGVDGLGGLLSAYLPLANGEWIVLPSAGFRTFDLDTGSSDFQVTDVRLNVERMISTRWSVHGAVSHLFADGGDTTQFEFGLRYHW